MKWALVFICCTIAANAQTAKVVALTPEESDHIRQLYKQQADIHQQIIDAGNAVIKKYLTVKQSPGTFGNMTSNCVGHNGLVKPGWGCGDVDEITYSEDFKFIVPQTPKVVQNNCGTTFSVPGWGGNYFTPYASNCPTPTCLSGITY